MTHLVENVWYIRSQATAKCNGHLHTSVHPLGSSHSARYSWVECRSNYVICESLGGEVGAGQGYRKSQNDVSPQWTNNSRPKVGGMIAGLSIHSTERSQGIERPVISRKKVSHAPVALRAPPCRRDASTSNTLPSRHVPVLLMRNTMVAHLLRYFMHPQKPMLVNVSRDANRVQLLL